MKKFISFLCALTIVLSASAVPAKPTHHQVKQTQEMQLLPTAEKAMLGQTIAPRTQLVPFDAQKASPKATALKTLGQKPAQKAARRPKLNLSVPQRAPKEDTTMLVEYGVAEEEDPYEGDADEDLNKEYAGIEYYDSGLSYDNVYYHIVQAFDENTFCGLYFLTEGAFITPGEYPLSNLAEPGTVSASSNIHSYSLVVSLTEEGNGTAPYWCMVSGLVTVTEDEIIVDAVNSKGHGIHATIPNQLPKQEEGVPTVADLKDLGYDLENDLVLAYRFIEDAQVCNDIVFVGNYNEWEVSEPDQLPRFEKLQGFDGWYVCSLPYWLHDLTAQGKPIQLKSDGSFNWEYQAGDADAWIHRGGNQAWLESWYAGEVNVYYEQPGAYIYDIAYWKNHNTPCDVQEERVIVAVNVPEGAPEAGVEVIGSFDGWTGVSMELLETGWYVAFDIKATAKDEFKFREAGTWENEIQYYDEENDMWYAFGNFKFGDLWTDESYQGESVKMIELDFSDPEHFRWRIEGEIPFVPTGDTIRLAFEEPMGYGYASEYQSWYFIELTDKYRVQLLIQSDNTASPAGHYTEEDLHPNLSYITELNVAGHLIKTAQIEVIEQEKRVDVYASLLCDDGNVYEVSMFYEEPEPQREENLIIENADVFLYGDPAWQIYGFNAERDRHINIATYGDLAEGDYLLSQLTWAGVHVFTNDTSYVWYNATEAELHVDYSEAAGVAFVTGWMIAAYEDDAILFNLNVTASLPTVKIYDTENEDFIAEYAEYTIYDDYVEDGGIIVEATNEDLQHIGLQFALPEGATGLVPGVYPIVNNEISDDPCVFGGKYVEYLSGNASLYYSYALQLVEKEGKYYWQKAWFLTEGEVVVSNDLTITINAVNSYGRDIKVVLHGQAPKQYCGDNLTWELENGVLTIEGTGDMWDFSYNAPWGFGVTEVNLPAGLTYIGEMAFYHSLKLTNVTIPATVKEIGISAFEDCRSLASVSFPRNSQLKAIDNWAFYNCHALAAINIPDGVETIGDGAFYGCVYAQSLNVPASMVAIGDNAFALCSKLAEIHVDAVLPPDIMEKTFYEVSLETPVFVPDGCYEVYKNHIYWGKLNIIKNTQGMDQVGSDAKVRKIVRDGQVLIIRGERTFTTTGAEIK